MIEPFLSSNRLLCSVNKRNYPRGPVGNPEASNLDATSVPYPGSTVDRPDMWAGGPGYAAAVAEYAA
jgi:hypothetical protein